MGRAVTRELAQRAAGLREAFDRSFAAPARPEPRPLLGLLAIRSGGQAYALRVSEVAGVHTQRPVTPLPGGHPGLLGLAGLRGVLVAVYDLGAVLGGSAAISPRWLVVAAGAGDVAFAIDALDSHVRVDPDALARSTSATPATGADAYRGWPVVRIGDLTRTVVSVPYLVESVSATQRGVDSHE
jgi:chemotaxis signal transduction protein